MSAVQVIEDRSIEYSEDALALIFAHRHEKTMRYVAATGKWMQFDGKVWIAEGTKLAWHLSRGICRGAANESNSKQQKLASKGTIDAVQYLAQTDRRIAATVDQWDTDAWLLNTPGGTVDLKTGTIRPNSPADYLTKITAVAPGGDCPQWHKFLDRATAGDGELKRFLQRIAGYALTGTIVEHILIFIYGLGGNGKGIFLNTLSAIYGTYAVTAAVEVFMASQADKHTTDLAMLRGARFVTAQETEEGRQWAESRIKSLTGGDPITARFMRQDNFTFSPAFKLVIAGNHKPVLRNVDEAMRRRLHLIPFTQTIPAEERDPELFDKLKEEWPGILQWAIEGCLEWQRIGLQPPETVKAATTEYFEDEDALSIWMDECCTRGPNEEGTTAELYSSWERWANKAGEHVGKKRTFSEALQSRGFENCRPKKQRGFAGISVKPIDTSGSQWQEY